jgi:MarR family 2-MHQ and catechol resistance regulon transcriptional repressor
MPTHYNGGEAEIRSLNTFIRLTRCVEAFNDRIEHVMIEAGLTTGQLATLEMLLHLGPQTQREIGKKMLRSSGNITMVIDNLERAGLVRRERSEEDRRVIMVHLTDKGRRTISTVFPKHAQAITEAMSVLTPAEIDQLGVLCKKLGLG